MTSIDRTKGTIIDFLGTDYYVAPTYRWTDMPCFQRAYDSAVDAFISAGADRPFDIEPEDVLVQEYPNSNHVAFLFECKIKGKPHVYPCVIELTDEVVARLKRIGGWGRSH